MVTLDELRADSTIDTVIMAFTDMQGRLLGKRLHRDFFLEQVEAGNVSEISAKGESIQGDFKKAVQYTAKAGEKPKAVDKFKTVRPAFGDDGLANLLITKNVTVNAHKVDTGTPLWQTIVFGLGPTLLLVFLFIALARRSSSAGARTARGSCPS